MEAIIYARQSFGQEQDSTSIEVQVEKCSEWAKSHGVNIARVFTDSNTSSELYPLCPEGMEAARIDRGFQRWLASQRTTLWASGYTSAGQTPVFGKLLQAQVV